MMKKMFYLLLALFLAACSGERDALIDREALVARNNPYITQADTLASLSVGNGHFALNGLLGKRNHLPFLGGNSRCQKVSASGVGELVLAPVVVFGKDVVHQTANHDGLGLFEAGTLELFDNHRLSLRTSMARRISRNAASSSERVAGFPARFTTSK